MGTDPSTSSKVQIQQGTSEAHEWNQTAGMDNTKEGSDHCARGGLTIARRIKTGSGLKIQETLATLVSCLMWKIFFILSQKF